MTTPHRTLQMALDALEDSYLSDEHRNYELQAKAIAALREAMAEPEPEPVTWQFRWTNPGNKPDVRPYELEWCEVVQTNSMYTIADAAADLLRHEFNGKPCYEVRPLYAAPPAAPAPAAPVPGALVEAVAKAIYWEWRRDAGYVPWVDGGNSLKQDDARKIARAVVSSAAPVVPLTDEQIRSMWKSSEFRGNGGQVDWFCEGIRAAEAHHRITGASK